MDIQKTISVTGESAKVLSSFFIPLGAGAITKAFTNSIKAHAPKMNKRFGRLSFAIGETALSMLVAHATSKYFEQMIDDVTNDLRIIAASGTLEKDVMRYLLDPKNDIDTDEEEEEEE